jgi:hypothetical protein
MTQTIWLLIILAGYYPGEDSSWTAVVAPNTYTSQKHCEREMAQIYAELNVSKLTRPTLVCTETTIRAPQ